MCTVHSKDMQLFLNSLMLNFLTPIGLKNFIPTNEDPLSPNIMVLERLEYMKYCQKSAYLEVCTVHSKDMQLFIGSLMLNFFDSDWTKKLHSY